jgi:hypothetical protein
MHSLVALYFTAMIVVTMALQASFYWSWGNGWENWRVGGPRIGCGVPSRKIVARLISRRVSVSLRLSLHQSPLKSWSYSQRPIGDAITSPDVQANFGTTNTQSRPRHQKCVIRRPTYPMTTRVELQERRVRLLALNLMRQKAKPSPRSTITRWASSGPSALLIRKRTRLLL